MNINFDKIKTGEVGNFLNLLYPKVESNSEALVIQLLTLFGNSLGQTAYFKVAEDKHYTNFYSVIVGQSSRGRKGQSLNMIKHLFKSIDENWFSKRVVKGLSTGEGLIKSLSDEYVEDPVSGIQIIKSEKDKRLLVLESEFSSILKMTQRDGNILSQVLRDAWDSVPLEILTKHDPMRAKNTHVSIIGHITSAELLRFLNSTEIANGMGNRFVFVKGERDKILPNPEPLGAGELEYMEKYLIMAIQQARKQSLMKFSAEAQSYWNKLYCSLDTIDSSIVGTLTARQEPQIRRLSMIIALFNAKEEIDLDSLLFAEAIFNYSVETLREIYGHTTGDPLTDKILDLLKSFPDGLSRSSLSNLLSRNYQKGSLDNSLRLLESQGLAFCQKSQSTGRPIEIWSYKDNTNLELNEINELSQSSFV